MSQLVNAEAVNSGNHKTVLASNYTTTKDLWRPCGNELWPERYKTLFALRSVGPGRKISRKP